MQCQHILVAQNSHARDDQVQTDLHLVNSGHQVSLVDMTKIFLLQDKMPSGNVGGAEGGGAKHCKYHFTDLEHNAVHDFSFVLKKIRCKFFIDPSLKNVLDPSHTMLGL